MGPKACQCYFVLGFFARNNALDGFLLESLLQHLIKVLIGCPLMYLAASPTMALGGICASHESGHTQLIHGIREQSPHRNQQWLLECVLCLSQRESCSWFDDRHHIGLITLTFGNLENRFLRDISLESIKFTALARKAT